ncbi:desulfoferrodoxin [Candidatus Woesearchaeota archaeon]|nr:desulfoferrodoxin [Candidatus Woesearchaeota archaeon]
MTEKKQIYKCPFCGNVVEVVYSGEEQLVCCRQPMKQLKENTEDAATEKHIPIIEKTENGVSVQVGSVPHPMDEDHYIVFIEIIADGKIYRQNLKPGNEPKAHFCIEAKEFAVRAYCNLHGLWKN